MYAIDTVILLFALVAGCAIVHYGRKYNAQYIAEDTPHAAEPLTVERAGVDPPSRAEAWRAREEQRAALARSTIEHYTPLAEHFRETYAAAMEAYTAARNAGKTGAELEKYYMSAYRAGETLYRIECKLERAAFTLNE